MTRLLVRSICLLAPLFVACSSGDGAGPGGGGSGGGGGGGSTGAAGSAGTSGNAGAGGSAGAVGSGGTGGVGGTGGAAGSGGANAGTGGAAGAGAAGSRGGTGGTAGSSGSAGSTAGAGGAGGSGGAGGARGGSGGSGGGSTGAGGTGGASSGLKLEYQNSSATATTFSVRLTNNGPSTQLISVIKVRYYFHDDSTNGDGGATGDATPMVTAATWKLAASSTPIDLRQTPGCSITASFPAAPKSAYVDFGCGLTSPMNVQDTITFSIVVNPTTQLAANDYSYADTGGAFVANDHLLVLLNGLVQSGTPPP